MRRPGGGLAHLSWTMGDAVFIIPQKRLCPHPPRVMRSIAPCIVGLTLAVNLGWSGVWLGLALTLDLY